MPKGFVYLVAFMDWFSRFVLSWQISISLGDEFVIEAAQSALNKYGNPNYSNQDQGSQFTSSDYIALWDQNHTKISMDGRGRGVWIISLQNGFGEVSNTKRFT